jgi:lipopolysaccharide heptosyltransferase I
VKAHRILLVRMSAMGDIIHTLPAAASLRHAFPEAEIDWVVEEVWAPLLEDNPHISAVRTVRSRDPRDVLGVIRALRGRAYDVALDFQGLVKSGFLAAMSGSKEVLGFRTEALREKVAAAFYHRQVIPAGAHVVEMNLSLARAAGAREASLEFPLPRPAQVDLPDRFVAVSPSAGWAAKCWPAESFAELIRRLEQERALPVVINCGPDDDELAGRVAQLAAPARPRIFRGGIHELVALAQRAAAFVAGDTGPLHIAAAAGTPVIALFGPTSPERNGPYGARVRVLRAEGAVTTYSRSEDASAMARLPVNDVFQALAEVL